VAKTLGKSLQLTPALRGGGPRTEAIAITGGLAGVATDTANGFDPTMISFQTTAA
jgi:hypothetical protein